MKKKKFRFVYVIKKEVDYNQIILKRYSDKKEAKHFFKNYTSTTASSNFKLIIQKYKNGVFVKNVKIKQIKK